VGDFVADLIAKLPYVFGTEIEYIKELGSKLTLDSKVLMLGVGPGEMALLLHKGAEEAGNPFKDVYGDKSFFEFWCVDNSSLGTYISHMTSCKYSPGYMLNYNTSYIYHEFKDESFDLIIVDASHKFEDVKADIEHYWPKLKWGGTILFHDFIKLEENNGVEQAINACFNEDWVEIARPGISIVYRKDMLRTRRMNA
jgi:SAM-dependent methyltransferase